jgi:signal transduction histidine kinase
MGKLQLELSVIPIWTLVQQTANEFNVDAMQKKITYVIDFSSLHETLNTHGRVKSARKYSAPERNGSRFDPPGQELTTFSSREVNRAKVIGDRAHIVQCIRNLISNALKFTPENGRLLFTSIRRCILLLELPEH